MFQMNKLLKCNKFTIEQGHSKRESLGVAA